MLLCLQKPTYQDLVSVRDTVSTPCFPLTTTQQEDSQAAGGATEVSTPGISSKGSGQRAYLQSLERSSRAWLLSSGKSPASDEVCGPRQDNGSNIWYNPIPEEEDGGGPPREEEVWKRRDGKQEAANLREDCGSDCPQEGANPSVSQQTDEITGKRTGNPPVVVLFHVQQIDYPPLADSPASDSSPTSVKKGGGAGSVMDRLRSPGTVRKLSLKMKKLPELRRKLSLRSSNRAHRQTNSRGGGDEPTNQNASSSPVLANQNVISRYHLDSSTPPARPQRRSSRQRSTSKGGQLPSTQL